MGTGSVIRPGDVQRMSAGTGVQHSEFNHSEKDKLHFLQIWITPKAEGIKPSYEEKKFSAEEKKNKLKLIVSPEGEQGSLKINQDAKVFASILDEGKSVMFELAPKRYGWVQVVKGSIDLNGQQLNEGDGAAIVEEQKLQLVGKKTSEFLLFDLP
jgi:quercetin 2,3-dioxygenase